MHFINLFIKLLGVTYFHIAIRETVSKLPVRKPF
jgi:hypothetical protein